MPITARPAVSAPNRSEPKDRSLLPPPSKKPRNLKSTAVLCQTDVSSQQLEDLEHQNRLLKQEVEDALNAREDALNRNCALEEVVARLRREKADLQSEVAALAESASVFKTEVEAQRIHQPFRAEKFRGQDLSIQKLTGLPSFLLMESLYFDFLNGNNDSFLSTIEYRTRADGKYPERKGSSGLKLDYFNQYFLTLFKLRTGVTDDVTGAVFGLSPSTANRYYNAWISVMEELFRDRFGDWPFLNELPAEIPQKMKDIFPRIDLIFDCFETEVQNPKNPDAARKCYSNYKKRNTLKVLVGIETDGNACFISHSYMGAISDVAIVRASGVLKRLPAGAVVLADRGFQLVDEARSVGVLWIVPPSKKPGRGLNPEEMVDTLRIARARILVERWIGRLRIWKQLEGPIAITEIKNYEKELTVVSYLCRFLPPLIDDSKHDQPSSEVEGSPNAPQEYEINFLLDEEL